MNFNKSIAPSPAGPIIIDITKLGISGSCILKINIAIAQLIAPIIACSMNFFSRKSTTTDSTIRIIPAIRTFGFIAITRFVACSVGIVNLFLLRIQ